MKNMTNKEVIDLSSVEKWREYVMPNGKRVNC